MKMSLKTSASLLAAALLAAGCGNSEPQTDTSAAPEEEIGATLTDKNDIDVADLPPAVLAAAAAVRPNVDFTEAEMEIRNGVTYYDVGGVDENGMEIELDIMQDGDDWRVVEVQRDISFDETPEPVKAALLENVPGAVPARIIESDQTDGVIIYEFYTRSADGAEAKHEVKLENGEAEFLTEEWVH